MFVEKRVFKTAMGIGSLFGKEMVLAYQTYVDKEKSGEMFFRYGKGNWSQAVSLVSILKNDVLNNWNDEMKTLQRIAEDGLF